MVALPVQLILPIKFHDTLTFQSFYPGQNRTLLNYLHSFILKKAGCYLYLWGHRGVGCTHLLRASCHQAQLQGFTALYFSLAELIRLGTPAVLEDLDVHSLDFVCIDDLERIAQHRIWQDILFHTYNRLQDYNVRLILVAKKVPHHLGLVLPDLVSRLSGGVLFQVQGLPDSEKISALKYYARCKGLVLLDEVAQFLLLRLPREISVLFAALDQLDNASLALQRKLTIPFVKTILKL